MRVLGVIVLAGALAAGARGQGTSAPAQTPEAVGKKDAAPANQGAEVGPGPARTVSQFSAQEKKKQPAVFMYDGGARETLESIVIPPKKGAPFTLTLETEWIKLLYDGGTITSANKRRIARDAKGRIYQERWFLVPKGGKVESQMTTIQIADPEAHTLYNCFFLQKEHVCELTGYIQSAMLRQPEEENSESVLPDDQGTELHVYLGKQFIQGVETKGTKDSTIINPGVFGNDKKVTVEREAWYSPELGFNLLSTRIDPPVGKQVFTVTSLTLGDPDPTLFELPQGFRVVDLRRGA